MRRIAHKNRQTEAVSKRSDRSLYRRAFPKGLALGLLTLAAVIVLTGSLVYGERGGDALFITPDGNVGIGTTEPEARLDIKGKGGHTVDLKVSGRIHSDSTKGGLWLSDKNDGFVGNNEGNVGFWTQGVDWKAFQINKSSGNVGIGTTEPKAKLHVNGKVQVQKDLEVKGDLFVHEKLAYFWGPDKVWKKIGNKAGNVAESKTTDGPKSSDLRFKSELQSIPSALNKILKLRGVTFRWNDEALQYFTRDIEDTLLAGPNATEAENHKLWQAEREKRYKELSKINIGIIAQDVEAVLPEAVTTDEEGYKSVRYHYLIPLLIEALKEQDKTAKEQAQVVAQQQQEITRLVAANLSVQQDLAELAAIKAQVAMLEGVVQRVVATQASGASDVMAHLFRTKAH